MTIYLDYNATAPVRPEVVDKIKEILADPANPSSVHGYGRAAKKHLEDARRIIANHISCWPDEVIFMGSATEANVTALGSAKGNVLVSAIEHSSILSSLRGSVATAAIQQKENWIASPAARNDVIPVDANGIVKLDALEKLLTEQKPALVSVMLANNEIGVIQPVSEIAQLCKAHGALLHCDAVQGLGKIPVDIGALGVDMLTLSAHKCGGMVGAAALVVRRGTPFAALFTGGQEGRRRAGTENVAAIAGFAKAIELFDFAHMQKLRGWLDAMENTMQSYGAEIFGKSAPRLPNTTCVSMPGVSQETQLMDFDIKGFAVSAGSACSSGRVEPSHVLAAMGASENAARSAIRISGGWKTTEADLISFTRAWLSTCERLAKTA